MAATCGPAAPSAPARPSARRSSAALGLTAALAVAGCSTLPARDPAEAAPGTSRVTVFGAAGPVTATQEKHTLQHVAAEGERDLLALQLDILLRSGDVNLYRGNRAHLLVDGPATFGAMKAAIAQARGRVLLESYIVEASGVAAEVAALLLQRAAAGVQVALLYDAVGSIGTPESFFKSLLDGGVAVCAFNPLSPTVRPGQGGLLGINRRDHRKLLVVDDDVAFTGGINISRVYGSGSFGRRPAAADGQALDDGWRDTQIELRGPVVPALAQVFAQTWHGQGCSGGLGTAAARPARQAAEPGQRIVKIMASDPRDPGNRIYTSLLAAVDGAQASVRMTMGYFAPGADFAQALRDAAVRGVRVELVLPGRSDNNLVLQAGRSYYADLLAAGVRIHETQHTMMHAKTAVIDGVFSTVGSSNLDWRSFVDNNELNVVVLGEDFGAEMTALFERDRLASTLITAEAWAARGLRLRLFELLGRMAERWL